MKSNYHAHSKWCKHASGDIEEICIGAIKANILEFAYTEHVSYPNYNRSRPDFDQLDMIMDKIEYVKEKYKNDIKIFKSLECEYVPELHDYYKSLKDKYNLDFLILGQHFSDVPPTMDYFKIDNDEMLKSFEDSIILAINSGLFKMVAHPDVFLNAYPFNEKAVEVSHNILKAIEENDLYIEINANGLRNNCNYPSKDFFKLSKEYNLKYLINADSHDLSHFDDKYIDLAYQFAKDLDITVCEFMK